MRRVVLFVVTVVCLIGGSFMVIASLALMAMTFQDYLLDHPVVQMASLPAGMTYVVVGVLAIVAWPIITVRSWVDSPRL